MTLATQLARELKVPMHMANLALDELTAALNRGWEDRDSRVAMLLQQERAGVKIEVTRRTSRPPSSATGSNKAPARRQTCM